MMPGPSTTCQTSAHMHTAARPQFPSMQPDGSCIRKLLHAHLLWSPWDGGPLVRAYMLVFEDVRDMACAPVADGAMPAQLANTPAGSCRGATGAPAPPITVTGPRRKGWPAPSASAVPAVGAQGRAASSGVLSRGREVLCPPSAAAGCFCSTQGTAKRPMHVRPPKPASQASALPRSTKNR